MEGMHNLIDKIRATMSALDPPSKNFKVINFRTTLLERALAIGIVRVVAVTCVSFSISQHFRPICLLPLAITSRSLALQQKVGEGVTVIFRHPKQSMQGEF